MRVDVQPVEHGGCRARRPPARDRSNGSGRRGTPSSSGLPRSWQTAPSMTTICRARSRSSMRVRAWSITISVWTQTSPSGCHSGSCSHPTSAWISGKSRSMTRRDRAPSANPIDGRAAQEQQLLDLSPDALRRADRRARCRGRGRASDRRGGIRIVRRTAPRAARGGCRRRRCGCRPRVERAPRDRRGR